MIIESKKKEQRIGFSGLNRKSLTGLAALAVVTFGLAESLNALVFSAPAISNGDAYDDAIAFRYIIPEQPNLKDLRITDGGRELASEVSRKAELLEVLVVGLDVRIVEADRTPAIEQ